MSNPPEATESGDSTAPVVEENEFEWELNRENVKPLRTGRRVGAMNKALSHMGPRAEVVANEKFTETMAECECSEDPLTNCLDFCNWFDDQFPVGRQRLFYQLLWKIVNKFARTDRYLEDERMMKIWTKLADNSLGHAWEVYQHANNIGSIRRCALLYIRWAQDLELRGAVSEARCVLNRAKHAGALPLEAIHDEEDQLEMREMRRQMDKARDADDETDEEEDAEFDENGQRVALTRIIGLGDTATAPVIRLPSIVGEQGSSRQDQGRAAATPVPQCRTPSFEVFVDVDDGPEENYLESIYDMHMDTRIDRIGLTNEARSKPRQAVSVCPRTVPSTFTVYEDEKENVDPAGGKMEKPAGKKPRIMMRKDLAIGNISIEEFRVSQWKEDQSKPIPPKVARKINFDEEDDD